MLKRWTLIFFGVLLAGFLAGLLHLFQLRFDDGDVYPPYSTLRADPLGARALYESLDRSGGWQVSRLYVSLREAPAGPGATLMLLGTPVMALDEVSAEDAAELEDFMREGGRVVVALYPENNDPRQRRGFWNRARKKQKEKEQAEEKASKKPAPEKKEKSKTKSPGKKSDPAGDGDDEDTPVKLASRVSLPKKWGIKFKYHDLAVETNGVSGALIARRLGDSAALPKAVSWHSALYFDELDSNWQTLYASEGKAVVAERPFGRGSLVLCSDSYCFSNEALRKDRATGLLVWLAGSGKKILFDETHLGVAEKAGIAALIRRYQLHWLALALAALAGAFIWKNATSFVPAVEEASVAAHELETGKDSAAGFVNLLRRNIPGAEILNVCLAEWKKSCLGRPGMKARVQRVEAVVAAEKARPNSARNPVVAYREISRILHERR